uniref:Uncharacterized protein n=1 Tax=Cannabis sativa TaxID=3483 RepID=A0A803R4Y3_CANSA
MNNLQIYSITFTLKYPKVASWARKKGYCFRGTNASLYNTRFPTPSSTVTAAATTISNPFLRSNSPPLVSTSDTL